MRSKLINDGPQRTYAVIMESGDEAVSTLQDFAAENRLHASQFTGIGAFSRVVFGFYDLRKKEYRRTPIDEQVEVVSLLGDIAVSEGKPKLHPHVVVAKIDGSAFGGHLLEAIVRPTLEIIVTESPAYLRRTFDRDVGLALIDLDAT